MDKHTVVVHEVRDGNTEQGALEAGIQATQTLAGYDFPDSLDGVGVGLLGLDLRPGREGDQRVSALFSACCYYCWRDLDGANGRQGH